MLRYARGSSATRRSVAGLRGHIDARVSTCRSRASRTDGSGANLAAAARKRHVMDGANGVGAAVCCHVRDERPDARHATGRKGPMWESLSGAMPLQAYGQGMRLHHHPLMANLLDRRVVHLSTQPVREMDGDDNPQMPPIAPPVRAPKPIPPVVASPPPPPLTHVQQPVRAEVVEAPRYFEDKFKPEDIKPDQGVEDPRKEENSPSTMIGVVRKYYTKTAQLVMATPGAISNFSIAALKWMWSFMIETIKNPASLGDRWNYIKKVTKDEFHHYALGTKLLWSDVKTSWSIVRRLLNGHTLTRRERRQLTRTTADLFRLVPFAFFVIVPFMEVLLPVALKLFPNMLPSTYKDNLKEEENMKRELKVRLGMAGFLKDIVDEIAKKKVKSGEESSAQLLHDFVQKARNGSHISTSEINRFARLFQDELTLDQMPRPQLASMCVFMGLRPYGADNFLRFQLRAKLRSLKEDDQRIVWEGIDNLNKEELREACRERGMRAYGLTQLGYRRQLQQWLDLSINKNVPISLLILSRAFTLDSKFVDPAAAVADSISSLDKDVVNEVLLEVASGSELKNPDIRARKLESVKRQNELIAEERQREEQRRKKAEEEKKKADEKKKAEAAAAKAAADATTASTDTQTAAEGSAAPKTGPVAAEVKAVKEAVEHATSITQPQAAAAPSVKPSERLPEEPVLTEAEIVSKPMPTLKPPVKPTAPAPAAAATQPSNNTSTASEKVMTETADSAATSAAAADTAAKEEKEKTATVGGVLSVAEVKALKTLVKESSVEQEKKVLAQLKAQLKQEEGAKVTETREALAAALAAAQLQVGQHMKTPEQVADGQKAEAPAKLDKSLEAMRKKVSSMLDKIEVTIDQVDHKIGSKLHVLDKDRDGKVTCAELSEAIFHVLKTRMSEEEASKIAQTLDKDSDGVLTVQELLEWIESKEKLLEELGSETENEAAAVATAKAPSSNTSPPSTPSDKPSAS